MKSSKCLQPPQCSTPTRKKAIFLYSLFQFPLLKFVAVCLSSSCSAGPSRVWLPSSLQPPTRELTAQLIKHSSPLIAWTRSKLSVSFMCRTQDSSCSLTSAEKRGKNHIPQSRSGCNLLAGWPIQRASQQHPHHLFFTDTALDSQPPAHSVARCHIILNDRFHIYCRQGVAMSSTC